jgi:DNA-binding response OmpR family regulator
MSDGIVLVVEDEENILEALRYNLEREGYVVYTASDGEDGLNLARSSQPDLVILDVMLPKMDGFEICRILRREMDVPIIMLTARGEEIDRIVGLELGADDYVTKPFSMREFMVRVRNMLRRVKLSSQAQLGLPDGDVLVAGDLEMDLASHIVRRDGTTVDMKPREYDLLALLVKNSGRVFSRDQLLQQLWSQDYYGDSRTVDVHVRWLREKIEKNPSKPERIVTVRGVGYRFDG